MRRIEPWRSFTAVVAVAGAVTIGIAAPAAAAPASCRPRVVDLGDPFGGHFSFADAVTPGGGIVVGTAFLGNGRARAVEWIGGRAVNLGVIGRWDESFAHGVDTGGTVVGELNYQQKKAAPFIWSNGRMRLLPQLGGDFGYAEEINERGTVVGVASDADGAPHAVTWTDGGTVVHDLGIAPGDAASFASGINVSGTAVGDSDDADGNERPAVFAGGAVTVLTGRSPYGSAEDVNDSGDVIGISFLRDGSEHATSWPGGATTGRDLGLLPGGTFASLVDLDDTGTAVGGGDTRAFHFTHAILWPGSGSLLMLRALSGRFYRDFSVARHLDEFGTAVGGSANSDGDIHGTVWNCAAAQAVPPASVPAEVGPSVSGTLPAHVIR